MAPDLKCQTWMHYLSLLPKVKYQKISPLTTISTRCRLLLMTLTDRQNKILKAIIDEYVATAEPVGSETLDKKYTLGVSPATLRNEMMSLTKAGYLLQTHTSAGRIPTPSAMRYYIQNLMKTKDMSVSEEVAVKEKLGESKKEFQKMLSDATKELAKRTKSLAVAADNEDNTYYSGVSNILNAPEFYDIDLTRSLLEMLDQVDNMHKLFAHGANVNEIQILMGEELGQRMFAPCGMIYTRFGNSKIGGTIGILGPYRFNYPVVIPTIRYFGDTIDQMLSSW